jgi:putative hydrolase of HD superfamily
MIEVEVGDMFILDKDPVKRLEQKTAAKEILCEKLPAELAKDLELHWDELITPTLPESRFVKAIDELDPMITNIDDPEIWQRYGFTEEKLRSRKEAAFESFPELQAFFELVLERLKKNGCI